MCAHELHLVQPNSCPHIHRLFVMSWELAGAHEGHGSRHIAHDTMEQGFKVYMYSHLYYWTISRVTNEITHNAIKKVLVYDIKFNWTVGRSVAGSSSCGSLQELMSASFCSIERIQVSFVGTRHCVWCVWYVCVYVLCGVFLCMCLCACAVYVCMLCVCCVCVCVCVCVAMCVFVCVMLHLVLKS